MSFAPASPPDVEQSVVPSIPVEGRTIVCDGTWLKTARILDELWLDNPLTSPARTIDAVGASELQPDLFTFSQSFPDVTPRHSHHLEWDNLAVAVTPSFDAWWNTLPQDTRRNLRRSERSGMVIREVSFDATLVVGIKAIYDEAPVRQGRRFSHYGKDLAVVGKEAAAYLDRSRFIAAFVGSELIGFLKLVLVGNGARIMQVLAAELHHEKYPTTALLAGAVRYCAENSIEHLVYDRYNYGNKRNSAVTAFKRRTGFQQVMIPRYYVPFTWRGRKALAGNLYRGLHEMTPAHLLSAISELRAFSPRRLFPRFPSLSVSNI